MIETLSVLVPHLKALHITALSLWCAALIALPLMLALHDPAIAQADYTRVRRSTHLTFTLLMTPAAVIAVISGTWLIFLREVFVPWLFLKLVFVGAMVAFHAWLGNILVRVAETSGTHRPPNPLPLTFVVMVPILAVIGLVTAKPDFGQVRFPGWLTTPMDQSLPFEVPSR